MPRPQYTLAEQLINGLTLGKAVMRGGRLTDRERNRLERIAEKAKDRGGVPHWDR